MSDNETIVIPRWSLPTVLVLLLILAGYFASPKDQAGRPIFLSPGVKAINDYRQSVVGWREQMAGIDAATTSILSGVYGSDLFEKSQQSQKNMEVAFWLVQEIERTEAPTASTPVRELAYRVSLTYLEAARAALVWSSAPTDENLADADALLQKAQAGMKKLEASEWLVQQ